MNFTSRSRRARALLAVTSALTLVALFIPSQASAIPAFARKYGLRCTACHEAWPALNDFGRAFRDNGYQLLEGKDDPTTTAPGYLPLSIRITPHYEFAAQTHQPTDQGATTFKSGGISNVGLDLLFAGTLFDNVSFLVVPTGFTSDEGVTLESAWVRFSNLGGSSWANLRLGQHEVDLPRSSHRPWSLASSGYLIYGYHSPGSISAYDMGQNQRGIEWMGHDRGSLTRAAISVFNVEGSPGTRNAFETPGVYAHLTHQWHFDRDGFSALRLGAFGSYATWPTATLTEGGEALPGQGSNLKGSSKVGLDANVWFGPTVTPLHLVAAFALGRDNKALIPNATRDGTFTGGFVELGYTPALNTTFFARSDVIRNRTQGVADNAGNLNDQDAETLGVRHTFDFSHRAVYTLHGEVSTLRTKLAGEDGSDVRSNTVFLGIDFGF